jgi:hypothetical protein
VTLATAQQTPLACPLCDNDSLTCPAASPVASGADVCSTRANALVRPVAGCQGGLFLVTYLHVYDELGLADPAVPTFNVHVFRSSEDSLAYTTCATNGTAPVTSLLLRSCVALERVDVGFLERDQSATPNVTVGPTFVVECLSQNGCSIRLESFNNCTLDQTGAVPIGVTGIVACFLVMCFCVFVWYYFAMHRRLVSVEMVVQLACIILIMLLNLVFWSAYLMTSFFVFPPFYTPVFGGGGVRPSQDSPYARMTDTVFWTDQVIARSLVSRVFAVLVPVCGGNARQSKASGNSVHLYSCCSCRMHRFAGFLLLANLRADSERDS